MFRVAFHHPRAALWQMRLARVPRWGWIFISVAVILPIVLLLASLMVVALVAGAVALAVVVIVLLLRGLWHRLIGPRDDGRRNVKVVVRQNPYLD